MVSPQPLDSHLSTHSSMLTRSNSNSNKMTLARPTSAATQRPPLHKSSQLPSHARVVSHSAVSRKRASFTPVNGASPGDSQQPYCWELFDELPSANTAAQEEGVAIDSLVDDSLPAFAVGGLLPDFNYAFDSSVANSHSLEPTLPLYLQPKQPSGVHECAVCWGQESRCADCVAHKKQQLFIDGWPVEFVPQQDFATSWVKQEPFHEQQQQFQEEKSGDMPPLAPLSAPLFQPVGVPMSPNAEHSSRVQGKLTRYLLEGELAQLEEVVSYAPETALLHSSPSHKLRARRTHRSRSPSPDLSERSASPHDEADDSAYDTDRCEADHLPASAATALSDSVSPPATRYQDGANSGSSASPPAPTRLLPVSARDLLPSRPSTAAIPPAHIKDRLVRSAKKLLTAADGASSALQVQVIPIYYPSKDAAGAYKIRLIRVENTDAGGSVSMYAHAADLGGVVERKSNISRLFGKFESPSEKLLMQVRSAHNHSIGQESNVLTCRGVRHFLAMNKMRDEHAFRAWIQATLLPKLTFDPLEVGDEVMEIEASSDPLMPHHVRPKKTAKRSSHSHNSSSQNASAAASSDKPKRSIDNGSDKKRSDKKRKHVDEETQPEQPEPIVEQPVVAAAAVVAPVEPFAPIQQQQFHFAAPVAGINGSAPMHFPFLGPTLSSQQLQQVGQKRPKYLNSQQLPPTFAGFTLPGMQGPAANFSGMSAHAA